LIALRCSYHKENGVFFLYQWLWATTFATTGVTLLLLPKRVRAWRGDGLLLLAFLAFVSFLAEYMTQNQFLFGIMLLPVLGWLTMGRWWKAWASISACCVLQNIGIYLVCFACAVIRSSTHTILVEGGLIWLMQASSLAVASPSLFDVLHVLGRRGTQAKDHMLAIPKPTIWPGCCFQVATHQEPLELLAIVIRRLMQQEYPGPWMVQIVDNNTSDPSLWKPLQTLCQELGERGQFLHLDPWPGFKAGALNEGTRHLPDWVSLIAVIDADYLVNEHFLSATVRHFADPTVSFVQTPQSYRNGGKGLRLFYDMAFLFQMASRAEWNAVCCTGTMLVLRRSCLEAIGGWDAHCIMEDLELSLRLLGRGWRGVYDHRVYGTGLLPFDFPSLAAQRFRWTFGTLQALKKHWRVLLGFPVREQLHLTLVQRLSFLGLGCQYLSDGLSFLSALVFLGMTGLSVWGWNMHLGFLPITVLLSMLLLASNLFRVVWALHEASGSTYAATITTLFFTFALSWTTARACLAACIRQRGVFLRTPKVRQGQRWRRAFQTTIQEILLALGLLGMAIATAISLNGSTIIIGLLLYQMGIYGITPVIAFSNEGALWLGGAKQPSHVLESHLTSSGRENALLHIE
jgi:cellulose synthase/poly-beta-1,6-N-acetylglucosamine synthase-like glycosyltransferase